ncbi:MAG: N-formylglutamate amidohydrolase [Prosthecobacter sp.]|nr:N-formylglutamate amidohydrolase [Prosthecobacter sp.]
MKKNLLLCMLLACAAPAADLAPGKSVFGEHNYIEYIPGDLPLVVCSPHGGRLTPEDIPDRTGGVVQPDVNTQELARAFAEVVHARTGHHMHLIISNLHRKELDPNREIEEAAQGSPIAQKAWNEYHGFIAQACAATVKQYGVAFFIDLHGQSHPDVRVELGYQHSAKDLAASDEQLNGPSFVAKSSIQLIAKRSDEPYSQLVRGPASLGALLEKRGFFAAPSPRMPSPQEPFFTGGYTVRRYCLAKEHVTGLQIETYKPKLRDTKESRQKFAEALVDVLEEYLPARLALQLNGTAVTSKAKAAR